MITVGVLLSPTKSRKLKLIEAVKSSIRGVDVQFTILDPLKSLEEQGLMNLDIIVHRLHDHLVKFPEIKCEDYIKLLQHEVDLYKIKLLSPIEQINMLADRVEIMKVLEPISNTNCGEFQICLPESFEIINQIVYNGVLDEKLERFPVVVKSTGSSFVTSERYNMKIYFQLNDGDRENLVKDLAKTRLAAQKFIDHDGRLYKMFIIGDKWHVVERKSIKNMSGRANKSTITFLSNSISKADSVSPLHEESPNGHSDVVLDEKSCDQLYNKVISCFDCQLLGVDFIIESGTKNIYIVDVNYFPGYDGFS